MNASIHFEIYDVTTTPKLLFARIVTTADADTTVSGKGTLPVVSGKNYQFSVNISSASSELGSVGFDFPDSVSQKTQMATRSATGTGASVVNATEGEKNIGGFFAPLQPQQGGTLSGVTYSLSGNNPNVVLFFSDTRTTTTANPNAAIIASTAPPPTITGQPQDLTVC
ncbi:MAG: hypothetical protein HY043_03200 [Verrucomicrobia bacterium]|nr:hypothetical protein [Verrucomicrobiota bacterium]